MSGKLLLVAVVYVPAIHRVAADAGDAAGDVAAARAAGVGGAGERPGTGGALEREDLVVAGRRVDERAGHVHRAAVERDAVTGWTGWRGRAPRSHRRVTACRRGGMAAPESGCGLAAVWLGSTAR